MALLSIVRLAILSLYGIGASDIATGGLGISGMANSGMAINEPVLNVNAGSEFGNGALSEPMCIFS